MDMITVVVTVLTALVGTGVTIMLFAIPWMMRIHGRLCSIETELKTSSATPRKVSRLGRRVSDHETRIRLIEAQNCQCEGE